MKHTGLVLIALIFVGGLVFAAGCIAAPANQSPEGNWILTSSGSGSTAEHPTGIINLQFTGLNVSGNSGVNNYFGTVTLDTAGGKLTFGPLGSTRMAGPENMMTQEYQYLAALANVTGYKITDGVLTLTDKGGKTLLTFAKMPATTIVETSWTLATDKNVTLEFANGKISGQAPVNLYFGGWNVTGATGITFGHIGSTLMAGPEAQMNAETAYFAALANVTGYKIADNTLTLTGKDGKTLLTFNKAGAAATPAPITGNWTLATDKNVTLNFGADSSFSGHAQVNLFFGSANVTGDGITFGNVGSTLMAGPEAQMNAETAFFAALGNVTGYKVAGDTLTFTGKDGKTLLTFNKAGAAVTPAPITGNWTLATDKNVTLNVTADGAFNGHAPVNLFFGTANVTGTSITFGNVGSTMMAGPEAQMNAETAFFAALGNVTSYKVVDGKLSLTGASGTTLLTFA